MRAIESCLIVLQRFKYKFNLDRKSIILRYIEKNSVSTLLEIGVFNGNFAERMIRTCKKKRNNKKIHYYGIDFFLENFTPNIYSNEISLIPSTKLEVLNKLEKIDNVSITLVQGNSTIEIPKLKNLPEIDLIHIDGGHSLLTVKLDWQNVAKLMSRNTVVFFDDYTNKRGVNKGKFGVNEVVDSIDKKMFNVIISKNRDFFWKSYGLLTLRMVCVKLK